MSQDDTLDKVKKLREITGVGYKDCKSAIDENNGDIEKSIEFLRKKGIAKANKKELNKVSTPKKEKEKKVKSVKKISQSIISKVKSLTSSKDKK